MHDHEAVLVRDCSNGRRRFGGHLAGWRTGGLPDRPIMLVVPFPAGGSTDLVARVVAEKMSQDLGQQIVVDNRGGAGGNVGAAAAPRPIPTATRS